MTVDAAKWASYLIDAEATREPVAPITETEPGMSEGEAYRVQAEVVATKVAAGDGVVGAKLGLTSRAKQIAMGVDQPCYGVLTSSMWLEPEAPVACGELIHPRAEPEIVFMLGEDLTGPEVTAHRVLDATAWVAPGLEIIDSRYAGFRFTHPDVVADNTSAARFVVGTTRVPPGAIEDVSLLGCVVDMRGLPVATAAGAATMGHPAAAVAHLVNSLVSQERGLSAGDVVLSGGLTDAFALTPGAAISATFRRLGTVTARGT